MAENDSAGPADGGPGSVRATSPGPSAPPVPVGGPQLTARLASQTRAVRDMYAAVWPLVLEQGQPADRALADYFRARHEFGSRDRRLMSQFLFGLLRWWGWLRDFAPAATAADLATNPAPWCRLCLATALVEDDEPLDLHAAWAAACGAPLADLRARPTPAERLAGLFRRPAATFADDALAPAWLADAVQPPCDLAQLRRWLQLRPPLWLRVQVPNVAAVIDELRVAGLAPAPAPTLPAALNLGRARLNLATLPAYREGRVEVQDVTSQAVAVICAARVGETWWDLCAGAGGKTLALARACGTGGQVLATDVRADALAELRRRAERAGLRNVATAAPARGDARTFDGVLVDAPCSGSGTWRRNPWRRWQTTPDDVAVHAGAQRDLLHRAAAGVRPGGVLVYATCSLLQPENGAVAGAFSAAHPAFAPDPFPHPFTGATCAGACQLWPWEADGDALFVARWRRVA